MNNLYSSLKLPACFLLWMYMQRTFCQVLCSKCLEWISNTGHFRANQMYVSTAWQQQHGFLRSRRKLHMLM